MKAKLALVTVLSLFAFPSFSAEESLSEMKSMAHDHISSKMSALRSTQDCISNAPTKEAFKACKYDLHEEMTKQKQEAMEEKKSMKPSM